MFRFTETGSLCNCAGFSFLVFDDQLIRFLLHGPGNVGGCLPGGFGQGFFFCFSFKKRNEAGTKQGKHRLNRRSSATGKDDRKKNGFPVQFYSDLFRGRQHAGHYQLCPPGNGRGIVQYKLPARLLRPDRCRSVSLFRRGWEKLYVRQADECRPSFRDLRRHVHPAMVPANGIGNDVCDMRPVNRIGSARTSACSGLPR